MSFVKSVYETISQFGLAYFDFGGLKIEFSSFYITNTCIYKLHSLLKSSQHPLLCTTDLTDDGHNHLQALNCLITCSMGALQIGHGSPLCFKTCAQGQQQQQCPVSPWIRVAFLGFSMQIIHLELTSVSSGDATAFPFSVTKDGLASAPDVGVKRSLAIQGFSCGLWLKLNLAARIEKKN